MGGWGGWKGFMGRWMDKWVDGVSGQSEWIDGYTDRYMGWLT